MNRILMQPGTPLRGSSSTACTANSLYPTLATFYVTTLRSMGAVACDGASSRLYSSILRLNKPFIRIAET